MKISNCNLIGSYGENEQKMRKRLVCCVVLTIDAY